MSNLKYSDENIILIVFYMNIKIMNNYLFFYLLIISCNITANKEYVDIHGIVFCGVIFNSDDLAKIIRSEIVSSFVLFLSSSVRSWVCNGFPSE